MKENFYPIDNDILKNNLEGAETIDYKKYPNLLNILFNHWIMRKENYTRIEGYFNRGEFELSIRIVAKDFGITNYRAEKLIKDFMKDDLINPIKKGSDKDNKSIYFNCIFSDGSSDSNQTVNQTVNSSNTNTLELDNQTVSKTVAQTVNQNSKKELIKKNYKKDIYSEIVERFNSTCNRLSKVIKITDKRKKSIDARIKEYDQETIYKVFDMVANNKFLNGDNDRGWKVDFDWLVNPNNFIKVLEGKYNKQEQQIQKRQKEECDYRVNRNVKADSVEDAIKLMRGEIDGR